MLGAPWGAAALRFLADPEPAPEAEALPASLRRAAPLLAARPALRVRAVEALCSLPEADDPFARPGARLLLLPEPLRLLQHVAAWLEAEAIARLVLRKEVEAARQELGAEAMEFATRRAGLLPRPDAALLTALGEAPRLRRAARLFGLAAAPIEPALSARLALRKPVALFATAAQFAREEVPETPLALAALRRILREIDPRWHGWLR